MCEYASDISIHKSHLLVTRQGVCAKSTHDLHHQRTNVSPLELQLAHAISAVGKLSVAPVNVPSNCHQSAFSHHTALVYATSVAGKLLVALVSVQSNCHQAALSHNTALALATSAAGKLLVALVREFLEWAGLEFTAKVFEPEMGPAAQYHGRMGLSKQLVRMGHTGHSSTWASLGV
eukprot:1147266-Pelagomonas_calceolata.AAC.3